MAGYVLRSPAASSKESAKQEAHILVDRGKNRIKHWSPHLIVHPCHFLSMHPQYMYIFLFINYIQVLLS